MEKIICACVKRKDRIWYGHRHSDALEAMNDELTWDLNRKEIMIEFVEHGIVNKL